MISDSTIDKFSAKYYCMFSDPQFKKAIKQIKSSSEFKERAQQMISDTSSKIEDIAQKSSNESEQRRVDEVLPFALAPIAVPALQTAAIAIGGLVTAWFGSKLAADATIALTKTETAAQIASTPVKEIVKQTPTGSDSKGGFWKWIAGTSLVSSIAGWVASFLGIAVETATQLTIGALGAIIVGTTALAKHLIPVVSMWIRRMRADGTVAEVIFRSDEDEYRMTYSSRDYRWHLFFAGSRLLAKNASPSSEDIEQLMKTEFFKKFYNKCRQDIHAMLDDQESLAVLKVLSSTVKKNDKDLSKALSSIIDDRVKFMQYFDNPLYVS